MWKWQPTKTALAKGEKTATAPKAERNSTVWKTQQVCYLLDGSSKVERCHRTALKGDQWPKAQMLQSQWSMSMRRLETNTTAAVGRSATAHRTRLNHDECLM